MASPYRDPIFILCAALVVKGASIRGGSTLGQEEDGLGEHSEQEEDSVESTQPGETLEKLEARVQALNHRIARAGGTTGGWHPREHDMFLTLMAQVGLRPGTREILPKT